MKQNKVIKYISYRIQVNKFLYYMRKIPLIKKLISPYVMGDIHLKENLMWLIFVLNKLQYLFRVGFYFLVMGLLSIAFVESNIAINGNSSRLNVFVTSIVLLKILKSGFSSILQEDSSEKWLLVKNFKISYKAFFFYRLRQAIINDVLYVLAFVTAIDFFGATLYQKIILSIILLTLTLIREAVFCRLGLLKLEQKKKAYNLIVSLMSFITMILLVLLLLFSYTSEFVRLLSHGLSGAIFVGLAYLSWNVLRRFAAYESLGMQQYREMKITNHKVSAQVELIFENARIDDDVDVTDSLTNTQRYKGLPLLNHVFLKRHRRLWFKPLKRRLIAVVGSTLVLCAYALYLKLVPQTSFRLDMGFLFDSVTPYIFLVYFLALGDSTCHAYFKSCDRALLHYSFYRRKEVIWKQFVNRFFTIFKVNMLIYIALILCLNSVRVLLTDVSTTQFLTLSLSVFGIFCFFSVHFLFLYYIIQPYDDNLEIKSPLYLGITFVTSFMIYQSDLLSSIPHADIVLTVFSFFYFVIAIYCVYLFAEKTFKIRK